MAIREVDPVSRIEGHLGVKVETDVDGNIIDAMAHGNLWRGFENFLLGREINDAITFTQRICGVCPVPHGTASMMAADTVLGYSKGHITFADDGTHGVPPKAVLIRNLVLAAEHLMSSITHFYHLVAPSYVQGPNMPPWTPYFNDEYYAEALRSAGAAVPNVVDPGLWDAVILSYVTALKIRRKTFEAGALFAGRMPMTSCFVAGGVTTDGTADLTDRCVEFEGLIREVGKFIVNEYVPIACALGALYPDFDNTGNSGAGWGAGVGRFLSWGIFPQLDDTLYIKGGFYNSGAVQFTAGTKAEVESQFLAGGENSVPDNLTEDISYSRYEVYEDDLDVYAADVHPNTSASAAYPGDVTRTKPVRANGYTYIKGPRWAGLPCEVGPLARVAVNGWYPVDGTTAFNTFAGDFGSSFADIYTVGGAGAAVETGVIGGAIAAGLTKDVLLDAVVDYLLTGVGGLSTMDRIRARALESFALVQRMVGTITQDLGAADGSGIAFADDGWIHELMTYTGTGVNADDTAGSTWRSATYPTGTSQGWGATEGPRGALMHQATITNGKIVAYQCIVPTTWNGSPKDDASGENGPMEQAVIGAVFSNNTKDIDSADGTATITTQGGVEVLRIAQSFDPCIACAVH